MSAPHGAPTPRLLAGEVGDAKAPCCRPATLAPHWGDPSATLERTPIAAAVIFARAPQAMRCAGRPHRRSPTRCSGPQFKGLATEQHRPPSDAGVQG